MTTLTPIRKILVDSSFLYALADPHDKYRPAALAFAEQYPDASLFVPDVVLVEVTYLLGRFVGHRAMQQFLKAFTESGMHLEPLTMPDIEHAYETMARYADARFDFVDCSIMALAQRLKISWICTFDRRDFSIYKSTNGSPLNLLP